MSAFSTTARPKGFGGSGGDTAGLVERMPPHDLAAEAGVLGSMIIDSQVIGPVCMFLQKNDMFFKEENQIIFKVLTDLFESNTPVDAMILHSTLKTKNLLEQVGGIEYIKDLAGAVPTSAHAEYYAAIVKEKAMLRSLITACTSTLRDCYDSGDAAATVLDRGEGRIFEIAQQKVSNRAVPLTEVLHETFEMLDRQNGEHFSGVQCGFIELDNLTSGLQRGEMIIIAARPSVGKCLAFDAEIVTADGAVRTIEELYRERQAKLLTLGGDLKLGWTEASAFVDDGVKPVFRVRTRLGRQIEATGSHPFLTVKGWKRLGEIGPGMRVAVPRKVACFGKRAMPACEVKLLGYLLGDGGLSGTCPKFTNTNGEIAAEFREAVGEFGGVRMELSETREGVAPSWRIVADRKTLGEKRAVFAALLTKALSEKKKPARQLALAVGVKSHTVHYWLHGRNVPGVKMMGRLAAELEISPASLVGELEDDLQRKGANGVTRWLTRLGLMGKKSAGKFVPGCVFELPKPQMAMFLNRLFSTDGWATVLSEGQSQIGYCSVSERLARQVQHLLLRFGVIASLRERRVLYKGTRRAAWQLDVTDAESIRTFAREIRIFGKAKALAKCVGALAGKKYQTNRDLIPIDVWEMVRKLKGEKTWRWVAEQMGLDPIGTNMHVGKRQPSRKRLSELADALESPALKDLAESDIYWDEIVSVESAGEKQVYDLTIPETHNFVANDMCVHNTAFVMNVVEHVGIDLKKPCAVFSLEMSKQQLAQRMLCSRSGVDSHKLRRNQLSKQDRDRLSYAVGELSQGQVFIDDTPGLTLMDLRTKARRLKLQYGIELLAIDYLQLMEAPGRAENRQQEIAAISRGVKALARELNIPVLCLSQLNRASESEQRLPRTSDLRESGCLSGDTLITMADSGKRVPIRELAGQCDFYVWAMDTKLLQLRRAQVSNAFCTGRKPVFRMETRLGRVIRATANHRFFTLDGWIRLDELKTGVSIALPRQIPFSTSSGELTGEKAALLGHLIGDGCTLPRHSIQYTTRELDLAETVVELVKRAFGESVKPRICDERLKCKSRHWYQVFLAASQRLTHGKSNPVAAWLKELGIFGLRSYEKYVPEIVFEQPVEIIGTFLRHLWATDGCIRPPSSSHAYPSIYYATSSQRLARDVQSLLVRVGINAVLRSRSQGTKGRTQYHIMVMGRDEILRFDEVIGAVGMYKKEALQASIEVIRNRNANTNRDLVPVSVWRSHVVPAMQKHEMSTRAFQSALGNHFCGNALYKAAPSRARMERIAAILPRARDLKQLAASDVYWDQIISISPDGEDEVFDLTVPQFANFIANDMVVHNSIEQDADVVMLLHREAVMHRGDQEWMDANPDKVNEALVIVAKQRNGPCDNVKLTFMANQTRFVNYTPGV